MNTTTAERLAQATRREGDRKVTYTWRNPVMNKQYHEPNDAGEQIELRFAHDKNRRQYTATLSKKWWQVSAGPIVTLFAIGDHENFPSVVIHAESVARYSDRSFAQFERQIVALLDDYMSEEECTVSELLKAVDAC